MPRRFQISAAWILNSGLRRERPIVIPRAWIPAKRSSRLNLIEHVGPVRARSLLEHFGDAPAILAASKAQLLRVRNIGEETAEEISSWEKTIDLAGELKRIAEFGCHVLISSDENYPPSLREIYDPPLVIYVQGGI